MRLISCFYCGVVLDTDRIDGPLIYAHDTGELIEDNATFENSKYVPAIICPVCHCKISYITGE